VLRKEQATNVEKDLFLRQKCRAKDFRGYTSADDKTRFEKFYLSDWSNGDVKKRIKHLFLGFDWLEVRLITSLGY
jgi:hypothetical protein